MLLTCYIVAFGLAIAAEQHGAQVRCFPYFHPDSPTNVTLIKKHSFYYPNSPKFDLENAKSHSLHFDFKFPRCHKRILNQEIYIAHIHTKL